MSGGPGSLVSWESLGREGRRHMLDLRPTRAGGRPAGGVPDLSIRDGHGRAGQGHSGPGLRGPRRAPGHRRSESTSRWPRWNGPAPSTGRSSCWSRRRARATSTTSRWRPPSTSPAATWRRSRMQYSKRPSPLSLGMIKDAREQNRLLWLRILERLRRAARAAPTGGALRRESRRAHQPGRVPALGDARACRPSASTAPCGSARRTAASGCTRSPVRTGSTWTATRWPSSTTSGSSRRSGTDQRARLRYVLVSHDNDGVTKFGADLLTTAPRWLGPDRPRRRDASTGRARAASRRPCGGGRSRRSSRALVDMKNAQIPGAYRAWAHDYRPDLPRFVSEVFDLPATPEQMARSRARCGSARRYERSCSPLRSRSLPADRPDPSGGEDAEAVGRPVGQHRREQAARQAAQLGEDQPGRGGESYGRQPLRPQPSRGPPRRRRCRPQPRSDLVAGVAEEACSRGRGDGGGTAGAHQGNGRACGCISSIRLLGWLLGRARRWAWLVQRGAAAQFDLSRWGV